MENLQARRLRNARLAFGVCVVCLLFGIETVVAHHIQPNPLSPLVWAVLGSVGAGALGLGLWLRHLSRRGTPSG